MSEATVQKQEAHWAAWPSIGTPFDSRPMRVEEVEDAGSLVILAELPGIDVQHDLDVHVHDQRLEIKATRRPRETTADDAPRHSEFRYGRFWRVLTLPHGARQTEIEATYRDGILEVRVPLTPAHPAPGRHIAVRQA